MSTEKTKIKSQEGLVASWKGLPMNIKIMDLATIAWAIIGILDIILVLAGVELNVRNFPLVFFPFFMIIVTFSLRLRLEEKPKQTRRIFITWTTIFIIMFLVALLIVIFYPPLIQ
ncbi:MAG: hypothetical protein GF308_11780 [Candidatus Heimdallarchaeota archaeon]|nr:hypothetical protein [Candidatus Heimdallarchaeota archaeon]